MDVISFVSQKGGSGKSSLTLCCAVAAEQAGRRTLILDMDGQATAEAWYQDRETKEEEKENEDDENGCLTQSIGHGRDGFIHQIRLVVYWDDLYTRWQRSLN